MGIHYRLDNRTVRAEDAGRPVGRIVVPDIDFIWGDGVCVKMAGIGGVQTEEAYRGQGVAGRMMQSARGMATDQGYCCSGISTTLGNVARRLYTRAGYTQLFRPGRFEKELVPRSGSMLPDVCFRPYEQGDENILIGLFEEIYRPYFGCRRKTAQRWRAQREKVLSEDPELIQVALRGDRVVGWAGCFDQWVGRVTELHVGPDDCRAAVATALLARVENTLYERGTQKAHIWASDEDTFTGEVLVRSGYRFCPMRVFYLAVIDLPGLLTTLTPLLDKRWDGRAGWVGRLGIQAPQQRAVLDVSSSIAVRGGSRTDLEIHLSEGALCRMLSGRCSAWELYLDNALSVSPAVTTEVAELLRVLFPFVPAFHPADDLW